MSSSVEVVLASVRPSPAIIWGRLTPEEACSWFDVFDMSIKQVRDSAGEQAADFYHEWILKRIL